MFDHEGRSWNNPHTLFMKGQVGLKCQILIKKLKLVRKFCEGNALFVEKCKDWQKIDENLLVLHFWGGEWGEK